MTVIRHNLKTQQKQKILQDVFVTGQHLSQTALRPGRAGNKSLILSKEGTLRSSAFSEEKRPTQLVIFLS